MRQGWMMAFSVVSALLVMGCVSTMPSNQTPVTPTTGEKTSRQQQAEDIAKMDTATAQANLALAQGAEAQERQDALADFMKGAGLGLGVAVGSRKNTVDDAAIINNKITVTKQQRDHLRVGFELHQLFTHNILTKTGKAAAKQELIDCAKDPIDCPMIAVGPFASIQSSAENTLDSFAVGAMVGVRSDPRQRTSFNIGVGIVWDAHVKTLADGFVEGQAPPTGETTVRFREGTARRFLVTVSFAF